MTPGADPGFATFWASREPTQAPEAARIAALGASLLQRVPHATGGAIAFRWHGRMVVTARGAPLGRLGPDDLVEVADYDATRRVALALGRKEPSERTPLLFLVLAMRPDLGALILMERAQAGDGATRGPEAHPTPLRLAEEALRGLRSASIVRLSGGAVLVAGRTLDEAERRLAEAPAAPSRAAP